MADGRMSAIRKSGALINFWRTHALGKGIGTQMVREFVQFLFEDPTVDQDSG
jgi:RimJ/RimL family protein N-acetyltransferase